MAAEVTVLASVSASLLPGIPLGPCIRIRVVGQAMFEKSGKAIRPHLFAPQFLSPIHRVPLEYVRKHDSV